MQYRNLGSTGFKVSALGFGAMRLPTRDENYANIDEEKAVAIIRRAFELGVNYIDTAYVYHEGNSEIVVGKAVKGWRDKIVISTKNHLYDGDGDTFRRALDEQLRRFDIEWIDIYNLHGLTIEAFEGNVIRSGGPLEAARKAQDEGLITHLCFSSHDTPENIIKLLDTGEFASLTCQYNLLDRANEPALVHAQEKGIGVVIMGPVGGGRLGPPSPEIQKLIPGGSRSTAETALRFVLSNPNVSCAISGMSTMQMVEENCATASRKEPLSSRERAATIAQLEEKQKLADLYCTGCNYCMPCPHGVDIPTNFIAMNYLRIYGLDEVARAQYAELIANSKSARECVECGQCEPKCPQKIPIISQLKETETSLG